MIIIIDVIIVIGYFYVVSKMEAPLYGEMRKEEIQAFNALYVNYEGKQSDRTVRN